MQPKHLTRSHLCFITDNMEILFLAFFVACASAASIEQTAQVLRSEFQQSPVDFQYTYETENGISGQASGQLKQISKDESAVVITGSNQYKSPEGEIIQLTYVADENGFQPQGSHIPTPPPPLPLSETVLRTLAYIEAHPYVEAKRP